ARDRTELHLGEAGTAGSGPGGARTQARRASQTARAAAVAGDAVAYRRQPPPVVSGRTLVRPDRDSGRCQQRDLLRPAGGGGIDGDGDGGTEGSDRAQRCVVRAVQRCGKNTSPSSIAVFRSRPGSGAMLLCPAEVVTWNGFSRCSSNAA